MIVQGISQYGNIYKLLIDIDSKESDDFDEIDEKYLKKIIQMI